jgi:lipoate-protein ligase B
MGRATSLSNLLCSRDYLDERGIDIFEIERGGDITFHGPGQLVGYPLMQLEKNERDVHRFVGNLESSLINLLAIYGIAAESRAKMTGVWTDQGKIAALGIHISRWITRHGFAMNIATDLSFFDLIVPCGIQGKGVTSMEAILARPVNMRKVAERYVSEFARSFTRNPVWISEECLNSRFQ